MFIRRIAIAVATVFALLTSMAAAPANAGTITWNWSYTGTDVNASGTIVSDDVINGLGGYSIQSISGQRNAIAISGMLGTGGSAQNNGWMSWDNTIFAGGVLDHVGIAYTTVDLTNVNDYNNAPNDYFEYLQGGDIHGIRNVWSAYIQHPDGGAVPEIWTFALVLGGLAAMAFVRRQGRMVPVSI